MPAQQALLTFDSPHSPTKVHKHRDLIADRRTINEQLRTQEAADYSISIEQCFKKFKQEYEPIIVEDVYEQEHIKTSIQQEEVKVRADGSQISEEMA
jgi:hypothetical protein